ncbi:MAG: SBBP repeat-containing protein [Candidatus Odinarchaeota archaeon]
MANLKIFSRKTALVGFLVLLSLGAFSHVIASAEMNPIDQVDFSTFLGGTGDDSIETVAYAFGSTTVDSKGNIIVVGRTESTDFPLKNAFQDHINGSRDSTISKYHPNGSLIFSTYFGGSAQELITDVAVDSEDNIVVAGITGSPDLPLLNAFKSNSTGINPGSVDTFIAKFSEDGQTLLFSTYFGGTGNDWVYTMNIGADDRIAISGATDSSDFPLLNAYQETNAGALDIFVALLAADGQSLLFSTYLGSTGIDHGRRVAFDSQGDILLAGITAIGDLSTEGVFQEEHAGGSSDAFLAKFHVNGSLEYFTYLGGASNEWGNDLAIDSEDNIVVTGYTTSDNFPILNAYQDEQAGSSDMFITKFTPDGQSIVFSTFLGGSAIDSGNAITIDSQDRIIVVGQTDSSDFPTTLPIEIAESLFDNASLIVLNRDGSLLLSMVFGGDHNDVAIGVAWHSDDSFAIIGYTESADFPVYEAYQGTYGGNSDMFVMKIDLQGFIDVPTSGFTFGLIEGGIVIGIIAVVVIVLFVRKRAG